MGVKQRVARVRLRQQSLVIWTFNTLYPCIGKFEQTCMDHCYGEYVNGGSVDGAATRRMLVKNNDEQSRCAFVSPAPWRTLLKNGRAPRRRRPCCSVRPASVFLLLDARQQWKFLFNSLTGVKWQFPAKTLGLDRLNSLSISRTS